MFEDKYSNYTSNKTDELDNFNITDTSTNTTSYNGTYDISLVTDLLDKVSTSNRTNLIQSQDFVI